MNDLLRKYGGPRNADRGGWFALQICLDGRSESEEGAEHSEVRTFVDADVARNGSRHADAVPAG